MTRARRLGVVGAVLVVLMLAALAATAGLAHRTFERELVPEIQNKAATLARAIAGLIGRAQSYDIPLNALVGVEPLFQKVQQQHPEIGLIAITDAEGRIIHSSTPLNTELTAALAAQVGPRPPPLNGLTLVSQRIDINGEPGGWVHLGVRQGVVAELLRENLLHVLVVVVVAFFLAFELAYFFTTTSAARPPDEAAAALGVMRAPLFLFLVAEDLSRSFLPVYSSDMSMSFSGLDVQFVQGLPITLFMLVVGMSQPVFGRLSERFGRRNVLLSAALIAAASHLGAAWSESLIALLGSRALAGVAWGLAFVAAQGVVLDHTQGERRTRGLAFFVGTIMVASVCGPSIGGILAEGIGMRATWEVAAVVALCAAGLVVWRMPVEPARARTPPVRWQDFVTLLSNRRFLTLLISAAMPAKIALIGFCFYLVPLYVPELGGNATLSGCALMLYGVVMVLAVPLFARHAGPVAARGRFVAGGLVISALAGLAPLVVPGVTAVAVLVVLLGLGQAMSIAPQVAMVTDVCRDEVARLGEGAVLGVYRLVERLGNVLGPLFAGALLQGLSFVHTFAVMSAFMLLAAGVFGLTFRGGQRMSSQT